MRKICALVLAAAILRHSNAKKIKTKGGKRFCYPVLRARRILKDLSFFMPGQKTGCGRYFRRYPPTFSLPQRLCNDYIRHSRVYPRRLYYRPRLPLIVMPSPSKSTETVLLSVMLRSIMPSAMLSSSFCSITLLKGRAPYSIS